MLAAVRGAAQATEQSMVVVWALVQCIKHDESIVVLALGQHAILRLKRSLEILLDIEKP